MLYNLAHKYHYVYKIVNKINGKFYIGIHSTNNLDDNYMGSGKALIAAIEKYGSIYFEKQILSIHETRDDALYEESILVTEDLVKNNDCYNLRTGGSSGFKYSDEWRVMVSTRAKANHTRTINSEGAAIKRNEANRRRAAAGEYSTPERREKIRQSILKQKEEISNRVKKDWENLEHVEMRKRKMKEAKANAPLKTCPYCQLQMKANLTRHIKSRHNNFELVK
jgi:hypothetical protein